MKSITRRTLLRQAVLASAGAMLAACAPKAAPTTAPTQPAATTAPVQATEPPTVQATPIARTIELEFWSFPLGLPTEQWPHGKWEAEVAKKFSDVAPGVKVNYQPLNWDNMDKPRLALIGGTPPNVFLRASAGYIHYALQGQCALEVELPDEFREDLIDGWWEGQEFLGKHYVVPFYVIAQPTSFNLSLIEEVGATDLLPPAPARGPWTFEQYTELMKKCTFDRGGGRKAWGWMFTSAPPSPASLWPTEVLAWNWGEVEHLAFDGTQWACAFNTDKAISWLQWMYDLYAVQQVMPNPNGLTEDPSALFKQGDLLGGVGFLPAIGTAGVTVDPDTLVIEDSNVKQKYIYVQNPTGPGVPHQYVWGGPMLDVNSMPFKVKDTDALKPSIDFCIYLANKEHQQWLAQYLNPVRKSALAALTDPLVKWQAEYCFPYGKLRNSSLAGVGLPVVTIYQQIIQKLYTGASPKELAAEFCEELKTVEFPASATALG